MLFEETDRSTKMRSQMKLAFFKLKTTFNDECCSIKRLITDTLKSQTQH